jgi:hypothetical protein
MPIDQITWVLRASMLIERGTEAFSETDGARVVWTDVTHQRIQLALLTATLRANLHAVVGSRIRPVSPICLRIGA